MTIFKNKTRNRIGVGNYGWQNIVEDELNINGLTEFGYISGYKDAADDLVEQTLGTELINLYMFPIVFLYRNYLELVLKNIIITKVPKKDLNKYTEKFNHDLKKTFKVVIKLIKDELSEKDIEKIYSVVSEFHTFDKNSFNFRYYFDKKANSTLPNVLSVDLIKLREEIDKVDSILYSYYN